MNATEGDPVPACTGRRSAVDEWIESIAMRRLFRPRNPS